jgi:hypothetical protein
MRDHKIQRSGKMPRSSMAINHLNFKVLLRRCIAATAVNSCRGFRLGMWGSPTHKNTPVSSHMRLNDPRETGKSLRGMKIYASFLNLHVHLFYISR